MSISPAYLIYVVLNTNVPTIAANNVIKLFPFVSIKRRYQTKKGIFD